MATRFFSLTSAPIVRGSFPRHFCFRISTDSIARCSRGSTTSPSPEYDKNYDCPVIFGPQSLEKILGEVVSAAGKKQLRIAETEKYPHVTYFFNGGVETPSPGEDRKIIPSPKVATYDLQPEMSAVASDRRSP